MPSTITSNSRVNKAQLECSVWIVRSNVTRALFTIMQQFSRVCSMLITKILVDAFFLALVGEATSSGAEIKVMQFQRVISSEIEVVLSWTLYRDFGDVFKYHKCHEGCSKYEPVINALRIRDDNICQCLYIDMYFPTSLVQPDDQMEQVIPTKGEF